MATKRLEMSPQAFERYLANLERTGTTKANINRIRQRQMKKTASPDAKQPRCTFCLMNVMKAANDMQKSVMEVQKTQSKFVKKLAKMEKNQIDGKKKQEKKAGKKLIGANNGSPYTYSGKSGDRSPPKLKTPIKATNMMVCAASPGPKMRPTMRRPKRIASRK